MYNLGFQHYQSYFMFDLSKKEAKLISQGITQDNRKDLIYTSEENDNIAKSFIIPDKSFNLTKDQCNQIELEYEKFGTLVALMFYALPCVIVLLNFFKVSVTVNLMLCIFITACAIISSGLRIIHKRRN